MPNCTDCKECSDLKNCDKKVVCGKCRGTGKTTRGRIHKGDAGHEITCVHCHGCGFNPHIKN